MCINFTEDELAVIDATVNHIANSTSLMESYDPTNKEYMLDGTLTEAFYNAMTKINCVSNSNVEKGFNYFSS